MKRRTKCSCSSCQSACANKPGWMKFGDEVKMAKELGISVQELFDKHLMVDYWNTDSTHDTDVFILSPAVTSGAPGSVFPINPRGQCRFYIGGLCAVHKSSPFECRHYIHGASDEEVHANHREAMESWNNPQAQKRIADLMGHPPEAPAMSLGGIFELLNLY